MTPTSESVLIILKSTSHSHMSKDNNSGVSLTFNTIVLFFPHNFSWIPGNQFIKMILAIFTFRADKVFGPFALVQQFLRRHSKKLNDTWQLVAFVFSWKQRIPSQKFGQDATQAPHIDGHSVSGTQNYFGRSIKPGLNVSIDSLVFVTRAAKIDHLKKIVKKLVLTIQIVKRLPSTFMSYLLMRFETKAQHSL